MSTWKRLSNLAGGKARQTLDNLGGSFNSQDRAERELMQQALEAELQAEAKARGEGPLDPGDLAARAREVRERIETARGMRTEPSGEARRVSSPASSTSAVRGEAAKDNGYEPPGPPEVNEDGSVKRTL